MSMRTRLKRMRATRTIKNIVRKTNVSCNYLPPFVCGMGCVPGFLAISYPNRPEKKVPCVYTEIVLLSVQPIRRHFRESQRA